MFDEPSQIKALMVVTIILVREDARINAVSLGSLPVNIFANLPSFADPDI